jgi:hypothetical protein
MKTPNYSQWYPITDTPNLSGYYAIRRIDKTRVEVVRAYPNAWHVFTYRNGEMADECRRMTSSNCTLSEAKSFANRILEAK